MMIICYFWYNYRLFLINNKSIYLETSHDKEIGIELQELSTNDIRNDRIQEEILIINKTEQIIRNDGSCLNIHVHILQRKKEKHKHLFTTKRIGFMKLVLFFFAVSFVVIGKIYGTVILLLSNQLT